jgi:hypothetical protein
MKKSKMFLSFLSILVISSLLFITNCSENPLEYEEKDLNSENVTDAVERGWTGPMDEVTYVCQKSLGDGWGKYYRCGAATHDMAYNWLKTKGTVSNAPTNQNYKDATIDFTDGGYWKDVNDGYNGSDDPKGIGEVFGRNLDFSIDTEDDKEKAFSSLKSYLKWGYPVETAKQTVDCIIVGGVVNILYL